MSAVPHMFAVDIATDRLKLEEGFRFQPYDDSTGKTVTCRPEGNLTWLYGFNLEVIGSRTLGDLILNHLVTNIHTQLLPLDWYLQLNSNRKSVMLDVAYNDGVAGLLTYHKMIAALSLPMPNYAAAAYELGNSIAAEKLKSRYAKLEQILLTGEL